MVRLLLVDDMPDVLETLELVFTFDPDIEIVGTVHNNTEALNILQHKVVDMVSIDIYMGMYNGFDLCRSIRRMMPQVFITMCSTDGSPDNRRLAESLGAHYFLEKPIFVKDVGDLVSSYQSWVNERERIRMKGRR